MICCTHVYSSLFLKHATSNRNEQVNATMTRKAKITIIIALMLGMALAALDTTIVGTALPSIVGKLGGITLYSWVFSAYLLTSTTTVPIYGKLADLFGRKPLFLFGTRHLI